MWEPVRGRCHPVLLLSTCLLLLVEAEVVAMPQVAVAQVVCMPIQIFQ
jgi:hypothetical protein